MDKPEANYGGRGARPATHYAWRWSSLRREWGGMMPTEPDGLLGWVWYCPPRDWREDARAFRGQIGRILRSKKFQRDVIRYLVLLSCIAWAASLVVMFRSLWLLVDILDHLGRAKGGGG